MNYRQQQDIRASLRGQKQRMTVKAVVRLLNKTTIRSTNMSLEAAIQENNALMKQLIAALSGFAAGISVPATTEAITPSKPKAESKPVETKAKPEPAKAEAEIKPVTREDVAAALTEFISSKGKAPAVELLGKFGAARVPDLNPDKYGEFIAALESAK